ncbi:unnamed protein product [Linum tenue]|uniref:NF-kappa-B inhibitor-like protein 2 n=1 Tax=Linum tenue TaxID=586396 RepID=A0AAV0QJ18_9ROSI|nr:unnamed protein product [Linum tenue]
MDALAVSGFACFANCPNSLLPNSLHPVPYPPKPLLKKNPRLASVLKASYSPVSELAEDDVLQMFLEERAVSGDLISKVCDMFWQRDIVKLADADASKFVDTTLELEQVTEDDDNDGFLKLSGTREWILGASDAPVNKKAIAKLKRELMFLSIGIGTACCGYCLVTLSLQAAISYAVGVLFSLLYFQLLCQHSDNLSREMIPSIFMQKKAKKIGIRSEDLTDSFEKTIRGSGIALSSPRLVIPAAVYGLWVLCHHYIAIDLFDFQIVPAMFGMFVYKAAALVQVYRDNEDLQLIFPED